MTLHVDKSPQALNRVYCKYCNQWIDNNPKDVNMHNSYITHQMNVKKYNTRKIFEHKIEVKEKRELDKKIDEIQAKAEKHHLIQDVMQSDKNELKEEQEKKQDNYDIARELYGDDLFNEMVQPKKEKEIDKTKLFNQYMYALPTNIRLTYRNRIKDFNQFKK